MTTIKRTNFENHDFIALVALLDEYLRKCDGPDHAFYNQYNSVDELEHVIVFYARSKPIGCGAIKPFDTKTVEVKRMYVLPEARGKGVATQILNSLERWAFELNYEKCILETGKRQPEAIALYLKNEYTIIPNYGQYAGIANSMCFEKNI